MRGALWAPNVFASTWRSRRTPTPRIGHTERARGYNAPGGPCLSSTWAARSSRCRIVRQLHYLTMNLVWDVDPDPDATPEEGPGNFRQHEIAALSSGLRPPTWPTVPAEMNSWIAAANRLQARSPTFPEELAKVHRDFEAIHPFLDGNGRTGRLILNLILVRLGYPPAIIYKGDRAKYLKALRRADAGDCGALGEFIARAILDNLYKFIVPAIAGPARLVPLAALATDELSATTLRAAANRGALQATKGPDGQWRSSRRWVDDYTSSRYKRRR